MARPKPAPLPEWDRLLPMLVDERPFDLDAPGWVYELKFDGYRLLAQFGNGSCRLRTKNGADATRWFPEIVRSLSAVPGGPHICDGEVCVLDDLGRSDFDRLHARAARRGFPAGAEAVTYCVFDLLARDGASLIGQALVQRKEQLADLLRPLPERVLVLGFFESGGRQLFEQAVLQLKLEGLVAKRPESIYVPGVRSADWVKVKRRGAVPPERFRRSRKS